VYVVLSLFETVSYFKLDVLVVLLDLTTVCTVGYTVKVPVYCEGSCRVYCEGSCNMYLDALLLSDCPTGCHKVNAPICKSLWIRASAK
jgi:hypothetical protein